MFFVKNMFLNIVFYRFYSYLCIVVVKPVRLIKGKNNTKILRY